ncbi:MAG: MerR family transcriptional regulator [Lachnospiraceae bacterium]|nr:MerR family transcriptional regulator [Lachnospiraceae bacterium]
MDEELLKIGELAAFVGVSPKALRVYEKMEIIKPVKVDEETGYRYYSADQVKDLEALLEWRDMGFSLKEVKIIFSGKYSKEDIELILESKKKEWQEKIWIAEAKMNEIDRMGCNLKFDESTDLQSLSDKDRAWYLSKLAVVNDSNVRQAISEAIWL